MEATPVRLPRTRPLTNADLELMPEVRSPSTAMIDLTLKNAACERFGVESYWFLDPAARTLVAFELRISRYEQIGRYE